MDLGKERIATKHYEFPLDTTQPLTTAEIQKCSLDVNELSTPSINNKRKRKKRVQCKLDPQQLN
jgi:hypothetical protein